MKITTLGEPRFKSPVGRNVDEEIRVPEKILRDPKVPATPELLFELAGPRTKLFFDPKETCAGIVTCGGLCPGLNDVIRSVFLELHFIYGVKKVLGFRGGYIGLDPVQGKKPIVLTPELVDSIHREGGTFLGTSRGPVDVRLAVDNLINLGVNILFTVGGDGTQRGGNELFQEAKKRGYALSVIGIPKTIDNDVPFVTRSFGSEGP
jgi:6-phosphofructokinase 1